MATGTPGRFASLLRIFTLFAAIALLPAAAHAGGATFTVKLDPALTKIPVNGRVIVSIIGPAARLGRNAKPNGAPFWDDPQPIYAADAAGLAPGASVAINDGSDTFLTKPSVLPPGQYKAQARLIRSRTNSDWDRTPGNYFSANVVTFDVTAEGKPTPVELILDTATTVPTRAPTGRVEWVEVPSRLLSDFHQRSVTVRAAVVIPTEAVGVQPGQGRTFPAIYEVTGFGSDAYETAVEHAGRRNSGRNPQDAAAAELSKHAFWIVLDAESPNGHTLFADSDNNGPCGQALVEELIPALQIRYPLIDKPSARLLRGHSSGGWSTLWLALRYPETFGATWSSSPDPVDFRRLQTIDIYGEPDAFTDKAGKPRASYRRAGKSLMTVQQEVAGEQLMGPGNTSGQQWASWQAVWGPRTKEGRPEALFDPLTGAINKTAANAFKKYDINLLLRAEPDKYLPAFRDRVHLYCGTADNFFLNEAVELLRDAVTELSRGREGYTDKTGWTGSFKLIQGADHGTIFASPALRAIPEEMVAELRKHGHMPAAAKPNP